MGKQINILEILNNNTKKLGKLAQVTGWLSITIIIFEVIDLTIVSRFFWHGNVTIITLFKHIWLPVLPFLLVWLLVAIFSFLRKMGACIILLLFTSHYYFQAIRSLLSEKLITGFIGIIPFMASAIVLITLLYNVIFLIIWLRTATRNYIIVKNYLEQKEGDKTKCSQ